ncbi:hypothetical protein JOD54_003083 [Actinokineospora baliensis]|uniref:hypothetical protein n=1 Tax=Actinokineospora baliensis TaxID=547056 RepID=UPI00195A8874|nr:hypothetical protein [Actinokineospora baliensis]MBM7772879.1 hypothetical protein [Actinokineospora baliensis]
MPVSAVTAVLVHSPYLGPASLRPLADALAALGHPTVVLDLRPSVSAAPVHQRLIGAFADALSDAALTGPIALVGHGAAGPLLPAFADELEDDVRCLLYLDADLPTPGQSWRECNPAPYAELRGRSRDGLLPRWPEWSGSDPLAPIADADLRAEIAEEAPEVPLVFLKEDRPSVRWTGAAGYVHLSAEHRSDADTARDLGWPVRGVDLHHLAVATDAEPVATLVLEVLLGSQAATGG